MAEDRARFEQRLAALTAENEVLRRRIVELQDSFAGVVDAQQECVAGLAAKDALLANMSHEIRTPLNGIVGMLQVLGDADLPHHLRDDLDTVRQSSLCLLDLLNDVLDLSKIEAGKLAFESIDFDLGMLVEDVVELFAEQACRKNVELFCSFAPGSPECVRGDPARLRQILANLVGNAVKFTASGHVAVRIEHALRDDGRLLLRGFVADTGIGISESQLAHLFQPFAQADPSTARLYGGTGLGLSICRQLCQLMGGNLDVQSSPGAGSTFTFELRLDEPVEPPAAAAASRFAGRRIVVVEANDALAERLVEQFRAWGMVAETATSCARARDALLAAAGGDSCPDVVLLDASSDPQGAGEFAQWLRGDVRWSTVQVFHGLPLHLRGRAAGFADSADLGVVLSRPYRRSQLNRRLAAAFGAAVAEPAAAPQAPVRVTDKRVLVVEDSPVNQKVARRMLERLGFEVEVADDGAAAVRCARTGAYDLVLMDCQMPAMDGYEATRCLRTLGGSLAAVPIIAMTADAMLGTRDRCLAAGMNDYIAKPVRLADLEALLGRWFPVDVA